MTTTGRPPRSPFRFLNPDEPIGSYEIDKLALGFKGPFKIKEYARSVPLWRYEIDLVARKAKARETIAVREFRKAREDAKKFPCLA
jgi:hypothetical protein